MIDTKNMPGDWNAQVSVLLPEPVTRVAVSVHAVLLVDMLTIPLKPLRDVTVNVELTGVPVFNVKVVGATVSRKSWNLRMV